MKFDDTKGRSPIEGTRNEIPGMTLMGAAKRHLVDGFKIVSKLGQARLQGMFTSSRLAPGSIISESAGAPRDQFHLLELHRRYGNIFTTWSGGKLTTCIVGHELGLRFLTENKAKLRAATIDMTPIFPEGFLRAMEGETHVDYRRMFLAAFRAVSLEGRSAELRAILHGRLTQLTTGEGRLQSAAAAQILKQASTAAMLQIVLGAKDGSSIAGELTDAFNDYAPNGMHIVITPTERAKYARIRELVLTLANDLKEAEGPPSSLLEYMVRSQMLDDTVVGNLIHMTEFARYDFHGLWRWILLELAGEENYLNSIAVEPDAARREVMAKSAVSETLRMQQSEFILRTATTSIVFEGFLVPRRSRVRICIWEAHRDATRFVDPDVFKPDRFVDQKFSSASYAPLGLDHHRCPGANWTHQLGGMLVEELAENFTVKLLNYGTVTRGHFHYEPGPDSQISLMARR
ncbi:MULTISPECIES: cytochrome P450 [unclassified Mesorhizobium]|uniref:cytochrome P450 n=1 Tax=unclassified Mesorhizobium TaxID=325217 RepID=UPI0015CA31C7|nr:MULTISPECIES: cytochrome P450 [unclassified Mesorhizobium]